MHSIKKMNNSNKIHCENVFLNYVLLRNFEYFRSLHHIQLTIDSIFFLSQSKLLIDEYDKQKKKLIKGLFRHKEEKKMQTENSKHVG